MELIYPQKRVTDADFSNGKCATGGTPTEQRYALATVPDGSGGERTLGLLAFGIGKRSWCDAIADRTGLLVVAVAPKAREQRMVTVTSDEIAAGEGQYRQQVGRDRRRPEVGLEGEQVAGPALLAALGTFPGQRLP